MANITSEMESLTRILVIIAIAIGAHVVVLSLRWLSVKIMNLRLSSSFSKTKTIASFVTSIILFSVYFAAFGLILKELGVSLTAYIASASVLGLAIGFGSQGFVQDMVTGITVIFSDLFDVGDMVEISGHSGIVKRIGMRFTVLMNSFGAEVFIPNRTITNVISYPRGYVRCLADITLSQDKTLAQEMEVVISQIVKAALEQFSGILLSEPSMEVRQKTSSGREYLRVKFRIWPGRGGPLETAFKQEVVQAMKAIEPTYGEWMVTINYEVEAKSASPQSGPGKKG